MCVLKILKYNFNKFSLFSKIYFLIKYTSVSAAALLLDYSSYVLLVYYGRFNLFFSASLSYFFGLTLAYILLVKKVFNNKNQKIIDNKKIFLFIISGLLGLLITNFVIYIYISNFNNPYYAKICAVFFSFCFVLLFRKYIVFK